VSDVMSFLGYQLWTKPDMIKAIGYPQIVSVDVLEVINIDSLCFLIMNNHILH
jgi:hypothetical protein